MTELVLLLVGLVLLIGVGRFLFGDDIPKKAKTWSKRDLASYGRAKSLVSPAELALDRVLRKHLTPIGVRIHAKTRLRDIFTVGARGFPLSKNARFGLHQRIAPRHTDFTLTDRDGVILALVELDDRSHNTSAARKADRFKNELAAATGLPLYRIRTGSIYNEHVAGIARDLSGYLDTPYR